MSNVVKAERAEAYSSALAFDLADIERQAAEVISAAQASAAGILASASKDADAMRSQAAAEGRAAGTKEGREAGLSAGREEGRKAGIAAAKGEIEAATRTLVEACEQLGRMKDGLFSLAESDLLKLAILIARKVVAKEVSADSHISAVNVKRCLEMLSQRKNLVVRVAPQAVALVQESLPDLARRMGDLASVKIAGDDSVAPGGCLVTGESGVLDATIESQFAEVERILFGEPNA